MAVVCSASSTRFTGASGIVTIIAPFPAVDKLELPTMFNAEILAKMLEPQARLNGSACKVDI